MPTQTVPETGFATGALYESNIAGRLRHAPVAWLWRAERMLRMGSQDFTELADQRNAGFFV